ncbi:MAG: peptidylprolyl isomerase [Alphaproteobacteria bacterium]
MTTRLYLLALPLAAFIAFSAVPPAMAAADSSLIAIVNGKEIKRDDVEKAVKKLKIQAPQADQRALFPMAVEQLVNQQIIDDAAKDAKLQDTSEYKSRIAALNQEIEEQKAALPVEVARQMYIEKRLKDKVNDKAVKEEYNKFRLENEGKMELNAKHIIVQSEEEAAQIIKELNDGAKFDDLAKQRSSGATAGAGGELGWFRREDMIPEFSDAAFKIKKGEWSKEPLKTKFGYHVIFVSDKRTREVPTFDQIKDGIRNKMLQETVAEVLKKLREKAKVEMFDDKGRPLSFPAPVPKDADKKASAKDETE